MKKTNNGGVRQAYCRPATWIVPCEVTPFMSPSPHAVGNGWNEVDGGGLNWNNGRPAGAGDPVGNFSFKSVWDATAKELQNGELVIVPIE